MSRWQPRALVLVVALSAIVATAAGADDELTRGSRGFQYTIQPGETLSHIASRFETRTEVLVAANPGLDPNRVRAGRSIVVVGGVTRVRHTVRAGENLTRIADRYAVTVSSLLALNQMERDDPLRIGQTLEVYTHRPPSVSRSVGNPHTGRLLEGRQCPQWHPGLWVRRPDRAWGTDETIRWLLDGIEAVRARFEPTPRLELHDISRRRGGPLWGHRSHRSGRDVDISYYQTRCTDNVCPFRRVAAENLDTARQWALFRYWLEREQVEAIFVDHGLQAALYRHARREGVDRRRLSRWFQYPRRPEHRVGVIRHSRGHRNHAHIRFRCPQSDAECR